MKLIVSIYPKNQEFLPLTFVFNATLAYNRAASPSRTVIRHTLFAILFLSPPSFPLRFRDRTLRFVKYYLTDIYIFFNFIIAKERKKKDEETKIGSRNDQRPDENSNISRS